MPEPLLPNRDDLEYPLLRIIYDMGDNIDFSDQGREIEIKLAAKVGLSDDDRDFAAPNYNSKGHRKWRNHIQFVKDQLVNKDLIDNSKRDKWKLTAAGRALIEL